MFYQESAMIVGIIEKELPGDEDTTVDRRCKKTPRCTANAAVQFDQGGAGSGETVTSNDE
jgi:hypothetical protein